MRTMHALLISSALVLPGFFARSQAPDARATVSEQSGALESSPAPVTIPPEEQPTKEQLAQLFEVMRLRDQMQNLMRSIPAVVSQQVHSQMAQIMGKLAPGAALTQQQQDKLSELMNKYISRAMTVYTVDDMIADMTTVYQHHISRTDVDALIAFYSSPAGRHLLEAQPAIMKEYMPMVIARQQKATDVLTEEMSKDLDDFVKSVSAAQSTPAPHKVAPEPK